MAPTVANRFALTLFKCLALSLAFVLVLFCLTQMGCQRAATSEDSEGQKVGNRGAGSDSTNRQESSNEKQVDTAPMDDATLVREISLLAEKRCFADAFEQQGVDVLGLLFEWQKIQDEVTEYYSRSNGGSPQPHGTFVTNHDQSITAFYSHNKHFEMVVAKALMGESRRHLEFQQGMGSYPFMLNKINPEFLWKDTTSPDYERIGELVFAAFAGTDIDKHPENHSDLDEEIALVRSSWESLASSGATEWEFRIVHEAYMTSGLALFPDRFFSGDQGRLQLATWVHVRQKGEQTDGLRIGPLAGTLLSTGQPIELTTNGNRWHLIEVANLEPASLPETTRESEPDLEYQRKVSSSLANCSMHRKAKPLQDSISGRVAMPE